MQQTTNVIDRVHNLENAGMNRAQAEALTKLVHDSVTEAVQHLATKAELADLREQVLEVKAGLARLEDSHKAHMEHTDAQIALLRGEITEKMGKNLKYMALTVGFSTVAIIAAFFAAAFFAAVFFAMPVAG